MLATDEQFKGIYEGKSGLVIGRGNEPDYKPDPALDRFSGVKIGCNSAYRATDLDALVWMDTRGRVVTESQKIILDAAKCSPEMAAMPRLETHHALVRQGVEQVLKEEKSVGGQLGRPSGARFRTYERLKQYAEEVKNTLFDRQELHRAIEEIYRFPLREAAKDALNRLLRAHATNEDVALKVIALRDADALCVKTKEGESREPRIICSMGLSAPLSDSTVQAGRGDGK